MTLNTYAKYLDYFTLKPRQRSIRNDVVAIEFSKAVTLLAGRVWVGYDEGSKFEAALSIWLQPKVNSLTQKPPEPWSYDSCRDSGVSVWRKICWVFLRQMRPMKDTPIGGIPPQNPGPNFSGNVYIGGVYLHRHYSQTSQQDYYPLNELHALKPIYVNAGSRIIVNRDIFNILNYKTFNAWDAEVLVVVDE
jgi:hypothetical protein